MEAFSSDIVTVAAATQYRNLTVAAQSLQISQPHLSRLIQKVERQTGIALLNRESKKKSSWTEEGLRFFQEFKRHQDSFSDLVHTFKKLQFYRSLKIVCLEGLAEHTLQSLQKFRQVYATPSLQVDILDLSELDAGFATGAYDVAVSSHPPVAARNSWIKTIGYQHFNIYNKNAKENVVTHFELHKRKDRAHEWITNSLLVKRYCIENFSVAGEMPTKIFEKKKEVNDTPVLLMAHAGMDAKLWQILSKNF
jgi:hypothetical protein